MRKLIFLFFTGLIFVSLSISCGPKPAYKTAEGKQKWKKYNSMQYDRQDFQAPKGKKPKRRKPKN